MFVIFGLILVSVIVISAGMGIPHHLSAHRHPSLAELEAKSAQMEAEALLTPESVWEDNEKWIQQTDRILNPPSPPRGVEVCDVRL